MIKNEINAEVSMFLYRIKYKVFIQDEMRIQDFKSLNQRKEYSKTLDKSTTCLQRKCSLHLDNFSMKIIEYYFIQLCLY